MKEVKKDVEEQVEATDEVVDASEVTEETKVVEEVIDPTNSNAKKKLMNTKNKVFTIECRFSKFQKTL